MVRVIKDCEQGKEFIFKLPNGVIIGKAKNIDEFTAMVRNAPVESLVYHANGKHFAPWLRTIGEGAVAARMSMVAVSKENARDTLLKCLK